MTSVSCSGRPSAFAASSGSKRFSQQLSTPSAFAASIMCVATIAASSTPESRFPAG